MDSVCCAALHRQKLQKKKLDILWRGRYLVIVAQLKFFLVSASLVGVHPLATLGSTTVVSAAAR